MREILKINSWIEAFQGIISVKSSSTQELLKTFIKFLGNLSVPRNQMKSIISEHEQQREICAPRWVGRSFGPSSCNDSWQSIANRGTQPEQFFGWQPRHLFLDHARFCPCGKVVDVFHAVDIRYRPGCGALLLLLRGLYVHSRWANSSTEMWPLEVRRGGGGEEKRRDLFAPPRRNTHTQMLWTLPAGKGEIGAFRFNLITPQARRKTRPTFPVTIKILLILFR